MEEPFQLTVTTSLSEPIRSLVPPSTTTLPSATVVPSSTTPTSLSSEPMCLMATLPSSALTSPAMQSASNKSSATPTALPSLTLWNWTMFRAGWSSTRPSNWLWWVQSRTRSWSATASQSSRLWLWMSLRKYQARTRSLWLRAEPTSRTPNSQQLLAREESSSDWSPQPSTTQWSSTWTQWNMPTRLWLSTSGGVSLERSRSVTFAVPVQPVATQSPGMQLNASLDPTTQPERESESVWMQAIGALTETAHR